MLIQKGVRVRIRPMRLSTLILSESLRQITDWAFLPDSRLQGMPLQISSGIAPVENVPPENYG